VGAGSAAISPGGDSWFISNTTILAKGGASAADNSRYGAAGGGAASGLGQVRWSGGAGYTHSVANQWGGGGGSSAGYAGKGSNATGRYGATAPTGGGNGGNGATTNKAGYSGYVPGGGGGGADYSGGYEKIGGAGAGGQVVVSYFLFNTGTAWETAANWVGGTVPANTWRNAIIPDARNVTISSAVTIHSLDILGNSTVTIASGGSLTLDASYGVLSVAGTARLIIQPGGTLNLPANGTVYVPAAGNLVIAPGATLTIPAATTLTTAGPGSLIIEDGGSLLHNTANVQATMRREISRPAWRLISSPVAAQSISGDWTPATPAHGYDFFGWDEPTQTWKNHKQSSFNTWNSGGSFFPGRGYLVSFEATTPTVRSFAGSLNNGNISVAVTRRTGAGFYLGSNLLGNPYSSSIDWGLADHAQFADRFAYIYDPNLGGGGGYRTIDGSLPTSAGRLIAPNQGFFVIKRNAGIGTFTFTNAMRAHGGTFIKSSPGGDQMMFRLSHGSFFDETILRVLPEADTIRDPFDAIKFFSYSPEMPQLFTQSSDNAWLAINSIPPSSAGSEYIMGLRAPATGEYTLSLQATSGAFASGEVFIKDLVTGVVQNMSQNPLLTFQASQGDHAARFMVGFTQTTNLATRPEATANIYVYNNVLNLQFAHQESNRTLQVIDLIGRPVLDKGLGGDSSLQVPLDLKPGVYIVRITGQNTSLAQRVLVK
jgi:hypothetical protein